MRSSTAGSEAPGAAALLWGKQLPERKGMGEPSTDGSRGASVREGKERQEETGQQLLRAVCRGANAKSLQWL